MDGEIDIYFGGSDEFFVHRDDLNVFARAGKKMREAKVFLEIAVPTILRGHLPQTRSRILSLKTDWSKKRTDMAFMARKFCGSKFEAVHPLKLTSFDSILEHSKC